MSNANIEWALATATSIEVVFAAVWGKISGEWSVDMTPQSARLIKARALAAISEIHKITVELPQSEYAEVRRAIGLIIGSIEVDILMPVYTHYPALDDLSAKDLTAS